MHASNDVRIEAERRDDGIVLARTSGELDSLGAPVLREHLDGYLGDDVDFVVDLDGVTFLGSSGLQVLVDTERSAALRHRRWAVVGNHRVVLRPIELTGLAGTLPLQPTVPAAISSLKALRPAAVL
ncbi:anti-anti-sigma factor [Amycolatopsis bartoniae]|uniref:Anti-sigma factor antagonist n=1 Tax=Amycolatopsis bartoniae TaxID=941986 RepID=A0A8H9J4C1_9PSEU|nr:STAS domain-containing protein [Amycolatopsis bartoniae]MBB2935382.1 anti-anti-sigma factor [Amycolatopsis bartoniae]TVS99905.1 STAS domain-containing protein [Amycolatopsis bartoniae]GHF75681.1 anti-sigma factor antagonist [Amycolatopsis bartoniae]